MKQEATKKSKKLIWLIAGLVALLLVVGAVLAILLMPSGEQSSEPTGPVGGRPDLYWNVDRLLYVGNEESAGLSTREPGEDGLYHIRFAYNGELVEYTFADKRLVNVIDNQDVVGLSFDASGNPVDAIDPATIATEVAKSFFVVTNKNGTLTLNSSIAMNGMQLPTPVGELTQIYDVRPDAPNPGAIAEVEAMDKVVVYANDKGETTHVYIVERQPEADIYWRVDKMYDSTKKETTRVPDENGVYTITFAKDGKHVDLYTKDKELVTNLDQKGVAYNAPKGLQVDENNFIVSQMDPVVAIRGKLLCTEYHVTEINGTQVTATCLLAGAKEQGKAVTTDIPEDCPVYNVCVGGSATMIGEPTELQMYDRVIIYTDLEGKPVLVYVMYRMANTPMYWNIERKYNSTTQETAREPVNGYYVFKMAVGGKQVTLKTKDKKLASEIDSFSYFMCGLEVEGDIIKKVYKPVYVSGNDYYGAGGVRYAVETIGSILSFVTISSTNWSPTNLVMKPDVEIYDVTGYPGTKIGEKTTYNPGDTIRVVADYNDNITHIYVTARYTGKPIFYNFARKFNATLNESTRAVASAGVFAGYYVYKMASQGKTVTVLVPEKDKNIADIIDAQNAPIVALDAKKTTQFTDEEGNVIPNVYIAKMAYEAITSLQFGAKQANYRRFLSLEGGVMTTMIESTGATDQWKVAEDVKIYNCSTVYTNNRGELVKSLEYWDQIQGVATKQDGTIKEIYIMKRQAPSKFYYNGSRKYDSVNEKTTRKVAEPGQPYEGYYVYNLNCEGVDGTYITKRSDIADTIDSFNYVPFGLTVKVLDKANNVYLVTQAFDATSIKGVKNVPASNYDVTKIDGKNLTVTRYLPTATNIGATVELKLASNYKAYDVSSYAENYGGKVKLALGDRAYFIANMDGEVEWIYIWYKNTHQKGYMSKCPHCNKTVYWQPYSGNTYSANGADELHLYVTDSVKKRAQANHGKAGMDAKAKENTHVILDLNGQTLLNSSGRNFLVYGELTILDTVGGGKMIGGTATGIASGGAVMVQENGILNLLSGTLTEHPDNNTNANGGVIHLSGNATFNMKGGTVEGGTATNAGGNIYASGNSTINMTGGVVAGDFEVVSKDVTVRLGGNAQITDGKNGGLILPEGIVLPLDKITSETKVCVTAKGSFTAPTANAEQYLNNFYNESELFPVTVKDGVLYGGRLTYCQHCEKDVYWTPYGGKAATGHFILMEDLDMVNQITIGSHSTANHTAGKCNHDVDMVLDLNGHTISTGTGNSSYSRFALVYAGLAIMDSSEAQTGKIIATKDGPTLNAGLILASTGAKLKIYGGELTAAEGVTAGVGGLINLSGRLEMYGGKITNGTAVTAIDQKTGYPKNGYGGNLYIGTYGVAYIYGGEISGGTAKAYVAQNFNGETGEITEGFGKDAAGNNVVAAGGNIYNAGKLYIGTTEGDGTGALISGGKAPQGGNIYAGASFTLYKDGKIADGAAEKAFAAHSGFNGGNVYLSSGRATIMGEVVGGKAYSGGNFGCSGGTRVYLDGGKIVDGEATHWAGGNYYSNNGILQMLNGAVVSGGKAYGMGGNVYGANGAELQMADSTVTGGTSTSDHKNNVGGGNVYLAGRVPSASELENVELYPDGYDYARLTAENSTISDGKATKLNGGNVYAAYGTQISLVNSVVSGGEAGATAGNIYMVGEKTTMVMDATSELKDGKSLKTGTDTTYMGGGNLYIGSDATATISGKVLDGQSNLYGGNILMSNANLTLASGAVVTGGKTGFAGTSYGANICRWNTGDMVIEAGAAVTGGTDVNGDATDIYVNNANHGEASLVVAGTVGHLRINDKYVPTTLKGDVKIETLLLRGGNLLALDNLTENASVALSGFSGVFTSSIEPADKAEEYTAYFKDVDGIMTCSVKDGQLFMGIEKYCEHCDQIVQWNVFTKDTTGANGHFMLAEDLDLKTQLTIGNCSNHGKDTAKCNHTMDMVVDLNGHTINAGKGADGKVNNTGRFALVYGKLSIMDTSETKTGKIVASRNEVTTNAGGLILASTGSTLNLYSGSLENSGNFAAGTGGLVRAVTFNMYGGKIVGGVAKEGNGGNVYVTGTANIYGGEILGGTATPKVTQVPAQGETPATTTYENGLGGNVYCSGVLNIAGGTISGGQAYDGGNIFQDDTASKTITIGKDAIVSDGKATNNGGNIYADYTITAQGKVTGGEAGQYGGNIYSDASIMVGSSTDATVAAEISDGTAGATGGNIYGIWKIHVYKGSTVSGGNAKNGGNIGIGYLAGGGLLNVYGTVTGGTATNAGGNITGAGGTTINIDGGTVTGGNAGTTGGNIQSNNGFVNLINGATVTGGTATNSGGNIYHYTSTAGRKLVITDSTVSGGKTTATTGFIGGGNIAVIGKGTVTGALEVTKSTISGGASGRFGGNIMANIANITLGEGAVVDGGTASGVGKSIAKFTYGSVEILAGATVQGGTASSTVYMDNGIADTTSTMKVSGTVTVPVKMGSEKGKLALEVSGAAKMSNVSLYDGLLITVGELTEGAEIKIADAKEAMVFTNPITDGKADEYAKYFKPVTGEMGCGAVNGQLCFGTVAPCAHCGGENAVWLTFTEADAKTSGHWILKDNVTLNEQLTIGACPDAAKHGQAGNACNHDVDTVIDLNGYTVTCGKGTGRFALVYAKLSVQDSSTDSAKVGTITTSRTTESTLAGGLILASRGAEINLYGGLITVPEGYSANSGGIVNQGAGTFNMYGGTINGGTATSYATADKVGKAGQGGNLRISADAVFNMYGGTISNGKGGPVVTYKDKNDKDQTLRALGGNVYLLGTFNMFDGAIVTGGQTTGASGGNFYVVNGGIVNIHGGATVSNGIADGYSGGNFYNEGTVNIGCDAGNEACKDHDMTKEALVTGGQATQGGNFRAAGRINVYANGKVSNGEAKTATGGNMCLSSCVLTVNGGTIEGGSAKTSGGNVNLKPASGKTGSIIMNGGVIKNGEAGTNGGNVSMSGAGATLTMDKNAELVGGKSLKEGTYTTYNGGGNLFMDTNASATVYGKLTNGESKLYGGNVLMNNADLTLGDGAIVAGGLAPEGGRSIAKWNSGDVEILAGASVIGNDHSVGGINVSNGTAGTTAKIKLEGTAAVRIYVSYKSTSGGIDITVAGAPKLSELALSGGLKINVGELTENAEIKVSGVAAGAVFTNVMDPASRAANVAKYFKTLEGVEATAVDGALKF